MTKRWPNCGSTWPGWDSPEGQLQALKYRLADSQREFQRAEPEQQGRIQEDMAELERQIAKQQAVIANPREAKQRIQETIDRGLERVREPVKPVRGERRSKFINPPPLVAPTLFQDRHVETQQIGNFLKDETLDLAREQQDRWGEGAWLGSLGNCYGELGQTAQAIEHYEQALVISKEVGDRGGEAEVLGNLGNRYAELGQTAKSIAYHEKALAIHRELGSRDNGALALVNLGLLYADLGQTTKALQCCHEALVIAREIGSRFVEAAAKTCMGQVYLDQGKWEEASLAFQEAIEIADDTANTQVQQAARLGLAQAKLYQGRFVEARDMAEAAQAYNFPLSNHSISAVMGVATRRQGGTTWRPGRPLKRHASRPRSC